MRVLKKNGTALIVVWALDTTNEVNKKKKYESQDVLIPWIKTNGKGTEQRYYHLFKEGELGELCQSIEGTEIVSSNYEKGNYICVIKKI